jgi:type II secretion system protein I
MRVRLKAFTLIEVLIALVIVSIGFAAVLHMVNLQIQHRDYLQKKVLAHEAAMYVLAQMQLGKIDLSSAQSSGSVEEMGDTWDWQAKLSAIHGFSASNVTLVLQDPHSGDAVDHLSGVVLERNHAP